jgi:outer membrane immunogenic protein
MKSVVFVCSVLAILLVCGAVHAADAPGSPYNWTGFYVGLNAGVAINDSGYTLTPSGLFSQPAFASANPLRTDSGNFDEAAFTGGGQVGYNYQVGRFVFGVETDLNYNGVDESVSVNRALSAPLVGRFIHTVTQEFDYFGTVRGRVGVTPTGRWLIYGTGGLAYGHVSSKSNVLFTSAGDNYIGSSSDMRVGWTAGAGSEYAVAKNWVVRMEYLYVDLGTYSYSYTNQFFPGFNYTTDITTREHVLRAGVSFKF